MNLQAAVSFLTVVFLSSLSTAVPIDADVGSRDLHGERAVKKWNKEFNKIDRLVLDGEYEEALTRGDRLMKKMIDKISAGSESRKLVGSVYLLRALAAYGVGDQDQARWHWQIGLQMFPEILEQIDMARYGEAGRFLMTHPDPRGASYDAADLPENATLPIRKSGSQPRIPEARRMELQDPIAVKFRIVVDQDGSVRDPEILIADVEFTMVCVTLEAVRDWRFEPGTVDGRPVDMAYNLTTHFRTQVH